MKSYFGLSAGAALIIATAFFAFSPVQEDISDSTGQIGTFSSEEEFKDYVSSEPSTSYNSFGGDVDFRATTGDLAQESALDSGGGGSAKVERSSKTNIQVGGVNEPDILKNTGERIYYSPEETNYWYRGSKSNSSVFRTLPAENFSEIDEIEDSGRMFLGEKSLIFLGENITSYERENHTREWQLSLNSSEIISARKINSSIYLVLRKQIDFTDPCPVRPMSSVEIPCTEFYRPGDGQGSSNTYNIVKIDSKEGEVEKSRGFIGSGRNTVVYMSQNSVYLTYFKSKSVTEVRMDFLREKGSNFLDRSTMKRIREVAGYNLSEEAMSTELRNVINNYYKKMSEEEAQTAREELRNAWGNYTSERKRELSKTGIAKFDLDLELESQGSVPGRVNDQFSISEKEGDLRIATTVGGGWQFDARSANDLYVLDNDLEKKGQIQGMGLTERIYSVRYLNDKAYVVTFRRVDPFHVIDLSDPEDPNLEGKLKLPGFSSYLHPLSENRILGIGEEEGSVKAVIFDVTDGEPSIEDSKVLDDWYSSISESHHAFKIDRKHQVFFLPGSEGGHIFNYSQGLEQVKEVDIEDAKRASYVNDYLYVFGENNATVIDEKNWEEVKTTQFRNKSNHYLKEPVIREPVIR